jgi:branched-subunit amino acid aminotransferase/4-amino-4-deoxychorismate lyase
VTLVWRDGAVLPADAAAVRADDRGLTLGEGLFETMRWTPQDGLRRLGRHHARMAAGAQALGLPAPPSPDEIAQRASDLVRALGLGDAPVAVRLTLTGGPGPRGLAPPEVRAPALLMTAAALGSPPAPAALASVDIRRDPSRPSVRWKTLSYLDQVAALAQARALGADEAVMLSPFGHLAGAAAANLVVVVAGAAYTPRIEDGALAGVTRGALLDAGLVVEAAIDAAMLADASAIALTNALVGVRACRSLDGRMLDIADPVLAALGAAEHRLTA